MIQLNKKARERRKQDVFIVEGLRMFREVPRDRLVKTYVSENFLEDPEHEACYIRFSCNFQKILFGCRKTLTEETV